MTADGGGFLCAFRCFFFFYEAILSFFDFWTIFCLFFFLKKKNSFHFCFDLPQVSNC